MNPEPEVKRRLERIADRIEREIPTEGREPDDADFLRSLAPSSLIEEKRIREQATERLREALERAADALKRARDGLDLGLGQARINTGDTSPLPTDPATKRADFFLRDARLAEKNARAALSDTEEDPDAS